MGLSFNRISSCLRAQIQVVSFHRKQDQFHYYLPHHYPSLSNLVRLASAVNIVNFFSYSEHSGAPPILLFGQRKVAILFIKYSCNVFGLFGLTLRIFRIKLFSNIQRRNPQKILHSSLILRCLSSSALQVGQLSS